MCKEKFGHSITKEVEEKDGTKFMLTHVALPSISILERALEKIKSMYKEQFGHPVAEDIIEKDGIKFSIACGLPPSISTPKQLYPHYEGRLLPLHRHHIRHPVRHPLNTT